MLKQIPFVCCFVCFYIGSHSDCHHQCTLCYSQLAQLNQLLSRRQSEGSDSEPRIRRVRSSAAHIQEDHSDHNKQTDPEIGKWELRSIEYFQYFFMNFLLHLLRLKLMEDFGLQEIKVHHYLSLVYSLLQIKCLILALYRILDSCRRYVTFMFHIS